MQPWMWTSSLMCEARKGLWSGVDRREYTGENIGVGRWPPLMFVFSVFASPAVGWSLYELRYAKSVFL